MSDRISPLPRDTPLIASIAGKLTGFLSFEWDSWFRELTARLDSSANRIVTHTLTAQDASIAPTSLPIPSTSAGLFRVTVYSRITRAGGVSSSLTVTIGHTDSGVSITQSGPALTGNTTATTQTVTFLVRRDQATAVTFSTTYASAGVPTMNYRIDILVESL